MIDGHTLKTDYWFDKHEKKWVSLTYCDKCSTPMRWSEKLKEWIICYNHIVYKRRVYVISDGFNCKGCVFNVVVMLNSSGCNCPDNFPIKYCKTNKVFIQKMDSK